MNLHEHLERAAASARRALEDRAQDNHSPDPTVLRPVVEGWRGDEPVIVLITADASRDEALNAARVAAFAFGCDVLSVTTDTWAPRPGYEEYNPVTRRRVTKAESMRTGESAWGPGEMQDAVHNHGALEKGWISESLMTVVVNRAGDMAMSFQGYSQVHRRSALGIDSWEIAWEPPRFPTFDTREDGAQATGVIPETLVALMNAAPLDVLLAKVVGAADRFGVTQEQARAHMDCAAIKVLPRIGFQGAAMLTTDSEERAAVIEASLRGHGEMWRRGEPLDD